MEAFRLQFTSNGSFSLYNGRCNAYAPLQWNKSNLFDLVCKKALPLEIFGFSFSSHSFFHFSFFVAAVRPLYFLSTLFSSFRTSTNLITPGLVARHGMQDGPLLSAVQYTGDFCDRVKAQSLGACFYPWAHKRFTTGIMDLSPTMLLVCGRTIGGIWALALWWAELLFSKYRRYLY